VCATSPEDLAGRAGEVAGEVPEGGEVFGVVPVVFGPVGEAFGPEFEAGKQAVDLGHYEHLLKELGVLWPNVVQDSHANCATPSVRRSGGCSLGALPTQVT